MTAVGRSLVNNHETIGPLAYLVLRKENAFCLGILQKVNSSPFFCNGSVISMFYEAR